MPKGKTIFATTTETDFDYFEVHSGVFAVRRQINTTSDNPSVEPLEFTDQGITNKAGITQLRKGLGPTYTKSFFIATDQVFETITRFGYSGIAWDNFKGLEDKSFFDYFSNGGSLDRLIRFEMYDHSFWKADGTPLPYGIHFDYVSAQMDNLHYHLGKALDILSARSDVSFSDKTNYAVEEGEILEVPYYNSDAGRTHFLNFFWTPSEEQIAAIIAAKIDRYKLIFDEDMLGLRSGGAALYDGFYEKTIVEDED